MYVTAHNASDDDVVIDDEGSVIPAGQWGVVVPTNQSVAAAVNGGLLHVYPFGAEGDDGAETATALARTLNDTGAIVLDDER